MPRQPWRAEASCGCVMAFPQGLVSPCCVDHTYHISHQLAESMREVVRQRGGRCLICDTERATVQAILCHACFALALLQDPD